MQWNAEGLMRKKTELEHRMNKENIAICCMQETHLKKLRHSGLGDINTSELIEEETGGRVVL